VQSVQSPHERADQGLVDDEFDGVVTDEGHPQDVASSNLALRGDDAFDNLGPIAAKSECPDSTQVAAGWAAASTKEC
jgi:hypothetical protein